MSELHPVIIEEECKRIGCKGDIYRAKIGRLEAKLTLMTQALDDFKEAYPWTVAAYDDIQFSDQAVDALRRLMTTDKDVEREKGLR